MELHEHDVAHQRIRQVGVFAQRKRHVFKHRQIGEQGTKLEQHAHAPAGRIQARRIHATHILPVEQHFALLRPVLTANQAQHRGLAPARRPHERRDLAARDLQRHVAQDHALTVPEGDVAQFRQRAGRR